MSKPKRKRPSRPSIEELRPAPALDRMQIIRAALALLDEVGLDGLTMRILAHKLGIKAASLYWHIQNKQDLLSMMANEICAGIPAPHRSLPWQRQLEALGTAYRQALLGHRDAARVLAISGPPSGPHILRLTEMVLRTLLDAGFKPKDAAYAGSLLNDYVVMFVLEEARSAEPLVETGGSGASSPNWFAALPADEYPSLVTLANDLVQFDADKRFRFGTEILVNGLEARLVRRKA